MELLELLGTYEAHDRNVQRIYGGEGINIGQRRISEADYFRTVEFMHGVYSGRVPRWRLQEVMSTSDFPQLFGVILQRQTLASYREWPATWRSIAKIARLPDFRLVQRDYALTGLDTRLEEVKELAPYPAAELTEQAPLTYKLKKYGRRFPISWEAMINDVTNELKDVPKRFGVAAGRSEQYFFTSLYVSATGPRSTVYSVGNANIVTGNPALSITGLQTAFTVLFSQRDPISGEPIQIEAVVLEIPPTLTVVAKNILNATQIIVGADSAEQRILTENWMKDNVTLVVNPTLQMINTTNGTTAWYLHAAASVGKPLFEAGFLQGYEDPQLFMKSPNAVRIGGGGLIDPMQGDFDNDLVDYKIRHCYNGIIIDPLASVASEGDGT